MIDLQPYCSTESRVYEFVVISKWAGRDVHASWTSRRDLADKEASRMRGGIRPGLQFVEIAPAVEITATEYRALKTRGDTQ